MKIAKHTPELLVLNVPASAGCLAGLILGLPGLLLLLFFILPSLGSFSYSSLKCHRITPVQTQCKAFRVSFIHRYSHKFTLNQLQNVSLQKKSVPYGNGTKNAYRVILETHHQKLPFTTYYTSRFPQKLKSEIETFINNDNQDSLNIKVLPNFLGITFFIVILLMALPSLLFGGLIAIISQCSCTFDKRLNQVTWKTKGLFPEKRECHLNEMRFVEIQQQQHNHVLYVYLQSGKVFFRYHYITREEAVKIAGVINNFLNLN